MKIGITERGDAGLDFSWVKKMSTVDGAIIISKNINDELIGHLIRHQAKVIFHADITGHGGTKLEPNVPTATQSLSQLKELIHRGFPVDHIVLRVDPVIPTQRGIETFGSVVKDAGILRVRFSVIDMYPHVRKRFEIAGLPLPYGENFYPSDSDLKRLQNFIHEELRAFQFATCAESRVEESKNDAHRAEIAHTGCISQHDLAILGLNGDHIPQNAGYQRKHCLCLACKTELLQSPHPCAHACVYCYWKQPGE